MNTFDTLRDDFFVDESYRWAQSTIDYYLFRLKPFFDYCHAENITQPAQITPRHLKRFFGVINKKYDSWHTRNGTYTVVQMFFCWMYSESHISENTFERAGIKRPRKVRQVVNALQTDHIISMIQAAVAQPGMYATRNLAIMVLLLTTGMRRSELTTLAMNKVDLITGWVLITGKGGHQRSVPLNADAVTVLQRWLAERPRTNANAVFITLHPDNMGRIYQQMKPDNINDILNRYRDLAGIPSTISVSPHKWRHAYATMLSRGGDPFSLQALLGHSNISTTAIYVDKKPEAQRALVENYLPKLTL